MATPQQQGLVFENDFAEHWGLQQTSGSGNGVKYKLDCGSVEVIMSLKHTTAESVRLSARDLRELNRHARGPAGRDQLGILVHRIDGIDEEIASLRVSDLFALLRGEIRLELRTSKRESKLAAADPLAYLRGRDE